MYEFELFIGMTTIAYTLGILQLYGYYCFHSINNLVIVKKRYPQLIKIEAIVVITHLFILNPLWNNVLLKATDFGLGENMKYVHIIGWICGNVGLHLISVIEVGRLWLVSYRLNYLNSSKNEQWKSQINHSFAEKDWYLKNRKKYGNKKYVIIRMFVFFVISTTIPLILFYTVFGFQHLHFFGFVDGVIYSAPVLMLIYLYYKLPKDTNDNFFFHYEFRITACISAVSLVLYFLNQIVFFLETLQIVVFLHCHIVHCIHIGFVLINHTINTLLSIVVAAPPSLLSTVLIPRKILSLKSWKQSSRDVLKNKSAIAMAEIHDMDIKVIDTKNAGNANAEIGVDRHLFETLKHEKTFEIFIEWMYREFSSESILCFVELVQFTNYLVKYIKDENIEHTQDFESEWHNKYLNCLYDEIPKSSIVSGNDNVLYIDEMDRIKNVAHLLYEKYIKYDSEFEVNIAAKLRLKYIELDEGNWNIEVTEFVSVFDAVLKEMFGFMKNSFTRYYQ